LAPLHSFPTRRSSDLLPLGHGGDELVEVLEAALGLVRALLAQGGGVAGLVDDGGEERGGGQLVGLAREVVHQLDELGGAPHGRGDRKSTRLNSSHVKI